MKTWKNIINTFVKVETKFDSLRRLLSLRLKLNDPIQITPYLGYGTTKHLYLKGRVLENENIEPPSTDDTILDNIINIYKRLESDEVVGARLKARFRGLEEETVTDNEGFFEVHFDMPSPLEDEAFWYDVELELIEPSLSKEEKISCKGWVMVPSHTAQFGVISDIDDTVIKTEATNLLAMAKNTLLHNAHTRLPFDGVPAFYKALKHGTHATAFNPIFYVSSSPWNLYDLFIDMFEFHHIPLGPLLLQDYGLDENTMFIKEHHIHKLEQIKKVLQIYPKLPFILIGDSGQKDPEIYEEVVRTYPNQIKAIYIRDVSSERRDKEVERIAERVKKLDVDMLLVWNTFVAAEHAIKHRLIPAEKLAHIGANLVDKV